MPGGNAGEHVTAVTAEKPLPLYNNAGGEKMAVLRGETVSELVQCGVRVVEGTHH